MTIIPNIWKDMESQKIPWFPNHRPALCSTWKAWKASIAQASHPHLRRPRRYRVSPPEGDLRAGEAQGLKLGHQQGIRALEAGSSSKSWTLPWKNEGFTEFDMKKWWFCWVLAILPWKNEGFTEFEMKKMMVLLSPSNSTMKKWGFYWVWNEKMMVLLSSSNSTMKKWGF